MNPIQIHKKFIFNSKIDQDWLYSLYEYDYHYILEVFSSSLETLKEELPVLSNAFEANDLEILRRSIHKIKPVFGFVGLNDHQEMCARFENACSSAHNTSNLTMQYIELVELTNEAKAILQEEYNRLTEFTA